MKKIKIRCDKCGGNGLYLRPTPYTVDGKPVCFKCDGAGHLLVDPRSIGKTAASGPVCKLAKVKTVDTGKVILVPEHEKNQQHYENQQINSSEIPY